MVQTVQVGDTIHNFPDEATPQMIAQALGVKAPDATPTTPESIFSKFTKSVFPLDLPLGFNVGIGLLSRAAGLKSPEAASMINTIPYAGKGGPSSTESLEKSVGNQLPEIAATTAIPPLRFAKFLPEGANFAKGLLNYGTDIAQNAAIGAGTSAMQGQSPEQGAETAAGTTAIINPLIQTFASGNPLVRLAGASGLGLLGAYGAQNILGTDSKTADLGGALAGAAIGLRGRNATDLATMNLLKNVDENTVLPKIEASRRLGLPYIRPSEAMNSGYIGSIEGSVGSYPDTSLFLEKQEKGRKSAEQDAIRNLYNTVFDDKQLSPQVTSLYQNAYASSITPQAFNNITKDEIVKQAMQNVDSNPVYKEAMKGVAPNSIGYLDIVKREMNDMATRAGYGTNESRIIGDSTNKLVTKMDQINPNYKVARDLANRQILAREMKNSINDAQLKGSNFYTKVIKNDDEFQNMMGRLKNVPQAQQQMRDARTIFSNINDQWDAGGRTGSKLAATGMSTPRSSGQWINNFLHKLQGGSYDQAMAELMTNPKWETEIARAKQMAVPSEKTRYVANLISRVSGKKITDDLSK